MGIFGLRAELMKRPNISWEWGMKMCNIIEDYERSAYTQWKLENRDWLDQFYPYPSYL